MGAQAVDVMGYLRQNRIIFVGEPITDKVRKQRVVGSDGERKQSPVEAEARQQTERLGRMRRHRC